MPCCHPSLRKDSGRWICAVCGEAVGVGEAPVPAVGASPSTTSVASTGPWLARHVYGLSIRGLLVAGVTLPVAWLVCWMFPFFNHILWMFTVLCHEMGHAAAALLMGRPALPAFDFGFGGGVTMIGDRRWWLLALYPIAAVILWRQADGHRWIRWAIASVLGVVTLLILTGLDEAWIAWMGFGGELVIATVFLHRALTGVAEVYPGERWLYGLVAWILLGHALGMCWKLLFDPAFQHTYLIGKRGIDNDFVLLTEGLGMSLRGVAWLNLLVGLLAPVAALLAARMWPRER